MDNLSEALQQRGRIQEAIGRLRKRCCDGSFLIHCCDRALIDPVDRGSANSQSDRGHGKLSEGLPEDSLVRQMLAIAKQ